MDLGGPRRVGRILLLLSVYLTLSAPCASADVVYLYDPLGRLVRVIDETGQAATYLYDPVGNVLQIARQTGLPQDQTSIVTVDPPSGTQGTEVTLTFTGTNLAGASFPSLPAGLSFVSSSLSVSGNQDVLTIRLAIDPEAPVGQETLTLVSALGGATPLPFSFEVLPQPPRVDRLIPPIVMIGSLVQIEGARFDETNPSNNQVTINSVQMPVVSVAPGKIIVQVLPGVATGLVTVTTPRGTGVSPTPLTVIPGGHPQQNAVTATLRSPFRTPDRVAVTADGTRAVVMGTGVGGVAVVNTVDHTVVAVPAITAPTGVAVTPDGTRGLVTRNNPSSLVVLDPLTGGITATIPLAAAPRDVVVSPDGAFAYVLLAGSPAVAVVDLGTLAEVASIALTSPARAFVAVSPDGSTVYAIGNRVSVIDATTRQVVREFQSSLALNVVSYALDTAAQRLYVTGFVLGSTFFTQVMDLQAGTVVSTLAARGVAVILSPDRARLYVLDGFNTLNVVNTATLQTVATLDVGSRPIGTSTSALQALVLSTEGGTLWVAGSTTNTVRVVDTQALALLAIIPVGLEPAALALIPSHPELYALNRLSNTVSVLDTATNEVRPTALEQFGLARPLGIVVPADGSAAYVANASAPTTTAFAVSTGAGLATLLMGDAHPGVHLAPARSRNELIVGNSTPPGVRVRDLSTRQEKRFLPLAKPPRAIALSLDERRLYVATELSGGTIGTQFTTFDAATGSMLAQLTLDATRTTDNIVVNPDGTRLYILHPQGGGVTTGTVRVLDTGTQSTIATVPVGAVPVQLALSRRGDRLYAVNTGSVSVIDPATNQVVTTISIGSFVNNNLVFSLDGSKAYLAAGGVKVINTATNTVTATIPAGFVRAVALSPDGQRLFAMRELSPGAVSVIDTGTDQVIATIPVPTISTTATGGFHPVNVTFSPDGARAWVVNALDDSISVIE